jgi:hypothetical protein
MHTDNYTILIGALLLWQLYASVLVALMKRWDLHQKLLHIGIIWALPLLGALYARFALNAAERAALTARQARGSDAVEAAGDGR